MNMELVRLFTTSRAYENLLLMDACGLLTALFPELEPQRSCAEVYYGKGGVLKHTLLVFKRMEYLAGWILIWICNDSKRN